MIEIRPATTSEDLLAVYRFRYAVYVEEMGRNQKYANHRDKLIADPLDVPAAKILAAWDSGEVVGTVRYNVLRSCDVGEYREYYDLTAIPYESLAATSITTRLMVHPRHRRTQLTHRLVCEAYRGGLEHGVTTDFIDCNAHLVDYFSRLGYLPHRTDLVHPEYGSVTVMRLNLIDLEHLERIRSPFRKFLKARCELRALVNCNGE